MGFRGGEEGQLHRRAHLCSISSRGDDMFASIDALPHFRALFSEDISGLGESGLHRGHVLDLGVLFSSGALPLLLPVVLAGAVPGYHHRAQHSNRGDQCARLICDGGVALLQSYPLLIFGRVWPCSYNSFCGHQQDCGGRRDQNQLSSGDGRLLPHRSHVLCNENPREMVSGQLHDGHTPEQPFHFSHVGAQWSSLPLAGLGVRLSPHVLEGMLLSSNLCVTVVLLQAPNLGLSLSKPSTPGSK
mmetsp:Transcript_10110/g.24887  ORF Transcript_10110/g.24887 Transcript_10110/m.24887 type:complete len:244 (-) Transcript_10110:151-882(-)